ncbi:MAG: thiamine pyrophosphate-binding protein, partial [Rhodospirillales bacterium]|nr:thiamine pyrophosphate-binding protein [Rhodospirillales bacterium]
MSGTPAQPERPALAPGAGNVLYGSDIVAETLRALDLPFIALTPGASFRGLHDSLVNHLGNEAPQMLLCLHEESAVSLAQGWAKVTGRPMAVAVHSNVGLMHATMPVFNAWCDRMPMLLIGATGPVDAAKRRPWIDWIHTAQDQNALVRHYVKWDAQPASVEAAREALLRAHWLTVTPPCAPVFVTLDAALQEAPLEAPPPPLDPARFAPAGVPDAAPEAIARAAAVLRDARHPVILMGRVGRGMDAWAARVALAEALRARVATSILGAAAFPTDHAAHLGAPATFAGPELIAALGDADAILSLDWIDLAGTLRAAGAFPPAARIVHVSLDHALHNGWSMDHQGFPPADILLPTTPDRAVASLSAALGVAAAPAPLGPPAPAPLVPAGPISVRGLAHALRAATAGHDVSILHLPLPW